MNIRHEMEIDPVLHGSAIQAAEGIDPTWVGWKYDATCGYWKNPDLTARVVARAEKIAKKRVRLFEDICRIPYLTPRSTVTLPVLTEIPRILCELEQVEPKDYDITTITVKVDEFGIQFPYFGAMGKPDNQTHEEALIERMGESLSHTMKHVSLWVVPPSVRRADASVLVCEDCKLEWKVPTYLGPNETAHHQRSFPDHTRHRLCMRPGNAVCWHGLGVNLNCTVDGLLDEMAEIPQSNCKQPLLHAPDCECAAL
jgi:hypothetical protein